MQATANVKHEEIVHQVARGSWNAARQEANEAIDLNEERCRAAMRQAAAVAEYSRLAAQRVSSEAGEQLRWAHAVHTEEKPELAALMRQLAERETYEEALRQALNDADVVPREQVAKAYQDGLEKAGSMASSRSLSHYSTPQDGAASVDSHHVISRHLAVGPQPMAGASYCRPPPCRQPIPSGRQPLPY